ncbi:MAG TPA: aspartate aminotransferase family protein [Thermoguttaceae bacterium]|nr:aspartate aminotransferase family protein [Thermoguttaceae bacterium]
MGVANVKTPLPGPKSKALIERWLRVEADSTGYQAPVVWETGRGSTVTDVDGNTYLDWTSGVLVTNVGHCHPHLVRAIQESAAKLINNYECPNEYRVLAAEKLVAALPDHMDKCFFLTTGSEAVEAAVRIMKRKTGRFEILGFTGGFHGRTYAAASVGGLAGPKRGYGPAMAGVIRAPFPYFYRCPFGSKTEEECADRHLEALDDVVRANSCGSLAGIIIESYQGAAGFIFPPAGYLKRLEGWARDKGILFTVDEVQSSYGRTGSQWGHTQEGLEPDLMCIGKGIGCGMPVAALAGRSDVFACLGKGEMSSTVGGNPVASAAVIAILEIMERENLSENARKMGPVIMGRLRQTQEKCRYLGDVRGRGLVMGLEFVKDKKTKEPAPELIRPIIDRCAQNGLLVGAVGIFGNVMRVAPPLVITEAEAHESCDIMEKVLLSLE